MPLFGSPFTRARDLYFELAWPVEIALDASVFDIMYYSDAAQMATRRILQTSTPWYRLDATDSDWASEDPSDLVTWLEQVLLIRRFEETVLDLAGQGLVHGPAHASIGQEAGAVGAMSVLGVGDRINGTH